MRREKEGLVLVVSVGCWLVLMVAVVVLVVADGDNVCLFSRGDDWSRLEDGLLLLNY